MLCGAVTSGRHGARPALVRPSPRPPSTRFSSSSTRATRTTWATTGTSSSTRSSPRAAPTPRSARRSPTARPTATPTNKHLPPAIKLDAMGAGATEPRVAGGPSGHGARHLDPQGRHLRAHLAHRRHAHALQRRDPSIAPGGSAARLAGNSERLLVGVPGRRARETRTAASSCGSVDPPPARWAARSPVNTLTHRPARPAGHRHARRTARRIVAWRSDGDIFFQRFDAAAQAGASTTRNAPLNTTGVDTTLPTSSTPRSRGANGYFVVAGEAPDPTTGKSNIAARFVGATTGFGYNSVSGQNDEFIAVRPQRPRRATVTPLPWP